MLFFIGNYNIYGSPAFLMAASGRQHPKQRLIVPRSSDVYSLDCKKQPIQ
jgi:hypothetical protein